MRPMSRHFLEIHGVDVAGDAIRQARENLRDVPHAHPREIHGTSLEDFADQSFDFVYSFAAVPLHPKPGTGACVSAGNPSRAAPRRPGAFAVQRFAGQSSAAFSSHELLEFAESHDVQVLALDGVSTQSM